MPDITIDGNSISGVTIDGQPVEEITIDGNVVWQSWGYNYESFPGAWQGDLSYFTAYTNSLQFDGYFYHLITNTEQPWEPGYRYNFSKVNFFENTSYIRIYFGGNGSTNDTNDTYYVEIKGSDAEIGKDTSNGDEVLGTITDIPSGSDFDVKFSIEWRTNGDITLIVERIDGSDSGSLTVNDTSYSGGNFVGIGEGEATVNLGTITREPL